jgi:hypothetical protein
MEQRRRRLLTDGLRQWLTMSADMQEMRLKWAADRHAKVRFALIRHETHVVMGTMTLQCTCTSLMYVHVHH